MGPRARLLSITVLFAVTAPLLAAACANGNVQTTDEDDASVDPTVDGSTNVLPEQDASTSDAAKKDAANPNDAPAPKLTSITPSKGPISSTPVVMKVVGSDFSSASVVEVNGTAIATTFVGATELQATMPAALLSATGQLAVKVTTPPPGGGTSAPLTYTVENPAVTTTSLAPMSALIGSPATLLTVTGTGFVTGSKIVFNGTDLPTTLKSPTSLEATIPAAQLTTAGNYAVTVVNPAPGGGTSTPLSFTVSTPAVVLSSVTPASAIIGSAATSIQLVGTGFLPTTEVLFNGTLITSAYVDSTHINATIPTGSLGTVGDFPITARNPPPGGGLSGPVSFRVQYAAPVLNSIAPTAASAGAGPTLVVATGSSFYPASQITFDGVAATTTYVSATELRATLTAAQVANGGVIAVRVSTPAPGGGVSGTQSLTVQNPSPTLTGLTPPSVMAGAAATTVTLTGSGFVAGSVVKANGTTISSTYVSSTTLTAVVPAASLVNPGAVSITVTNPNPGGGTSGAFNLNVTCNTTGVDVALGAVGNTTTLSTDFGAAATAPRLSSATTCPASVVTTNPQPAKYWVVQNTAGVPVTLSAWAVCSYDAASGRQDDAFLTFYRRSTRPVSDAERQACTGFVSEGASGGNGYSSPESNGSNWCPGLTKANLAGLSLGVCEKAVVHIQPYSNTSTSYTPPPSIKLRPEAP